MKLKKKCGAIKLRLEYLLSFKVPLLLNFLNSGFNTVPTKHLILVYKIPLSRSGLCGGRTARAALQSIKEQIIGKLKMIGTSNP